MLIANRLEGIRDEKRSYLLTDLAYHLERAGEKQRLLQLLQDFDYLEAKCAYSGLEALLSDLRLPSTSEMVSDYTAVTNVMDVRGLLNRERDKLEGWRPEVAPGQFGQQLLYGAQRWPMTNLAQAAQAWLERKGLSPWSLLWAAEPETEALKQVLPVNGDTAAHLSQEDGPLIFLGNGWLRYWSLATGELTFVQRIPGATVRSSATVGHHLIWSDGDALYFWHILLRRMVRQEPTPAVHTIEATDWKQLVVISETQLQRWDLETLRCMLRTETSLPAAHNPVVSGNYVISNERDRLRLVDLSDGNPVDLPVSATVWALDRAGDMIVVGEEDFSLSLWRLPDGRFLRKLAGHKEFVTCLLFWSRDRYIVSAGQDQVICIWDTGTGKKLHQYAGHRQPVTHMVAEPSNAWFVTLDGMARWGQMETGKARVIHYSWDTPTGGLIWVGDDPFPLISLDDQRSNASQVFISRDGRWLLIGYHDGSCNGWNVRTLLENLGSGGWQQRISTWLFKLSKKVELHLVAPQFRIAGHQGAITWLEADGGVLLTRAIDDSLRIWSIGDGSHAGDRAHAAAVVGLQRQAHAQRLVSISHDHSVKIWNLATGDLLATLRGHVGQIHCLAVSPDGALALTGGQDATVCVWDLREHTPLYRFNGHTAIVTDVHFAFQGTYALSIGLDGILNVWDFTTGEIVRRIELPEPALPTTAVNRLVYIDDTQFGIGYAAGSHGTGVFGVELNEDYPMSPIIDLEAGEIIGSLGVCNDLRFTLDYKTLLMIVNRRVKLLPVEALFEAPVILGEHEDRITDLLTPPGNQTAITADAAGVVKLWDLPERRLLAGWQAHDEGETRIGISPDGQWLVSAGNDRLAKIWSLAHQKCLASLQIEGSSRCLSVSGTDESPMVATLGDATGRLIHLGFPT